MNKKLTSGEISRIYKSAFSEEVLQKYNNLEVIRITKDYILLQDGTVLEKTDLTIKKPKNSVLTEFPWHVPLLSSEYKVIGIRINPNSSVIGFTTKKEEKYQLINILLDTENELEFIHLKFEYYTLNAAYFSRSLLDNTIHFPIAFIPGSVVSSLDIRIHIPPNASFSHDINLEPFLSVSHKNKKVLLTSQEQHIVGDISGYISLKHKNSVYAAFISLIIGLIFSVALLIIPDFKNDLGNLWYPSVAILTALGIFLSYKALKLNDSM